MASRSAWLQFLFLWVAALLVASCGVGTRDAAGTEASAEPTAKPTAPLLAASSGQRYQATTRRFQAVEGGSEFLETGSGLVTVHPRDTIPAIVDPVFTSREEADAWMEDEGLVIGLDIDGDVRAYPNKDP